MRTTSLNRTDIENFWIRCYLNPSGNLLNAAIDRAYRDFNRTLHGIAREQTAERQQGLKKEIEKIVSEVLINTFLNQNEFDKWHESQCMTLIKTYKEISNHKIFIGQAQKWINMSLKYLFALGENRINGISKNYEYFHFPLDNIIIQKLKNYGFPKLKVAWSRIDDYEEYISFQRLMRTKFSGQIPLDVEFRLYNE